MTEQQYSRLYVLNQAGICYQPRVQRWPMICGFKRPIAPSYAPKRKRTAELTLYSKAARLHHVATARGFEKLRDFAKFDFWPQMRGRGLSFHSSAAT